MCVVLGGEGSVMVGHNSGNVWRKKNREAPHKRWDLLDGEVPCRSGTVPCGSGALLCKSGRVPGRWYTAAAHADCIRHRVVL